MDVKVAGFWDGRGATTGKVSGYSVLPEGIQKQGGKKQHDARTTLHHPNNKGPGNPEN